MMSIKKQSNLDRVKKKMSRTYLTVDKVKCFKRVKIKFIMYKLFIKSIY